MDSYEYYLKYHKDFEGFVSELSETNGEIIAALDRLVINKKLLTEYERESCFEKVWFFVQSDKKFNEKLDGIFRGLLSPERFEAVVKPWINQNLYCLERKLEVDEFALMRVLMTTTKAFISSQPATGFFKDISVKLVDSLFNDSHSHSEIVSILHVMISENSVIGDWIMNLIHAKAHTRSDHMAMQIMCYFFKGMVEKGLEVNESELLRKYFVNLKDGTKKLGIFLIKILIDLKKFSPEDEESFKRFTIVAEALDESPHLIIPTLDLVKEITFSESFAYFWFVLCQMIIAHESSTVKNWGLDYILGSKSDVDNEQILFVLNALNSTCLFDTIEPPIELAALEKFIERNVEVVFKNLAEINWMSVPFYRILQLTEKSLRGTRNCNINADDLMKQTDILPKRIKNLIIRSGVQELYAEILWVVITASGFSQQTTQIMINIFNIDTTKSINPTKSSLSSIINSAQGEEIDFILAHGGSFDFTCYALCHLNIGKHTKDIIAATKNLKNRDKIVMKTTCLLTNGKRKSFDTIMLIQDSIKGFYNLMTIDDGTQLQEIFEIIKIGMRATKYKSNDVDELLEICRCLKVRGKKNKKIENLFYQLMELIFENHRDLNAAEFAEDILEGKRKQSAAIINCQYLIIKRHERGNNENETKYEETVLDNFLMNVDQFTSDCYTYDDLQFSIKLLECLIAEQPWRERFIDERKANLRIISEMTFKVFHSIIDLNVKNDLLSKLAQYLLFTNENVPSQGWQETTASLLEEMMEKISKSDQAVVLNLIIKCVSNTRSTVFQLENPLRSFVIRLLTEKMLETEMLTKEQQIESALGYQIESKILSRKSTNDNLLIVDVKHLRLDAADLLRQILKHEYPQAVEDFMVNFASASKKKPRYFQNSWIHRWKLHCLQPILFCDKLTSRTVDILLDELLNINNQLNVTHLIEIILARHRPNIIDILTDKESAANLKAQAIKSLFTIAVMQMKREDSFTLLDEKFFGIAEMKLETLHDAFMPYTMGQNYGVRSYAQAAILVLFKHVKSVFGHSRDSPVLSRIAKSCEIMTESMVFKNAAKFVENLQQDFRFAMKFEEIWSLHTFYYAIPKVTKMSFDEWITKVRDHDRVAIVKDGVVYKDSIFCTYKVAEMEADRDVVVVPDILEAPNQEKPASSSLNLQQKYVPFKYQVPTSKTLSIMPSMFKDHENQLSLQPKSNLVVVATLINLAPNLGGLSRTCEIFGAENLVIDSLKQIESLEFKSLSKTAEKWLKISEIKEWQLFDYLLGMRQQGYSIVGAEQSGKSVSLIGAKIPKKCVLLLGNEKKGIPADLLSLLDLTIELPQCGVVRSLNVHVSGAIVIWEYAKQHLFP